MRRYHQSMPARTTHIGKASLRGADGGKTLEEERGGRAALLARAIARNTKFRFCLRDDCRMCNQACKDGLSCGGNKGAAAAHDNDCRAIRTPLGGCPKLRVTADNLFPLGLAHHAVVLTIAAAARRQIRLTLRRQCKERLDKRQAQ